MGFYFTTVFIIMQRWIIKNYFLLGRGGSAGAKFRIALGLPVGAVINCADNTGKKQISSVISTLFITPYISYFLGVLCVFFKYFVALAVAEFSNVCSRKMFTFLSIWSTFFNLSCFDISLSSLPINIVFFHGATRRAVSTTSAIF